MSAQLQNRTPVPRRVLASPTIGGRQLWLIALALLTAVTLFLSRLANADVLMVNIAPPPLPVYEQPVIPGPGYVWVPGYWAYGSDGYYWVPGTWEQPPEVGLLWTPGYWAWSDDAYVWTAGYWGPVVGFYGGIVYGYGYPGRGYEGGYWRGNQFYYNRGVNNIRNTNITNVYSRTVVNNVTVNNVSYNGGPGGVNLRPTAQEQAAARGRREGPTAAQTQHVAAAAREPQLRVSVNHGTPPIAATRKPGSFSGPGIVQAGSSGAERQREAQQALQRQVEQPRHLAEAPRTALPQPQQRERAAPERPVPAEGMPPAPAERMAPPRATPQQKEPPRNEPRQQERRKPDANGRPQG